MIYYINRGDYHNLKDEKYPLRSIKSPHELKYCIDCGKQIYRTSQRCVECDHIHQRKCERPTREELSFLIQHYSFLQIGKMYGVSDNTIRKWCVLNGLPARKTDIKT